MNGARFLLMRILAASDYRGTKEVRCSLVGEYLALTFSLSHEDMSDNSLTWGCVEFPNAVHVGEGCLRLPLCRVVNRLGGVVVEQGS